MRGRHLDEFVARYAPVRPRSERVELFKLEYRLPRRRCGGCGTVTTAAPPHGQAGSISYGTNVNATAVLLGADGNVPVEATADLMAALVGAPVSTGFVVKTAQRLGVQFVECPGVPPGAADPVPEIADIRRRCCGRSRPGRAEIEDGYQAALEQYRSADGHDPPRHVQCQRRGRRPWRACPPRTTPAPGRKPATTGSPRRGPYSVRTSGSGPEVER